MKTLAWTGSQGTIANCMDIQILPLDFINHDWHLTASYDGFHYHEQVLLADSTMSILKVVSSMIISAST